jgi:hypothetical protein
VSQLDRRGRRIQLETLALIVRRGPLTEEGVAQLLGGVPEHIGRRLRRYARRGWLGRSYGLRGVEYFLREAGAARIRWIADHCGRTPSEETQVHP